LPVSGLADDDPSNYESEDFLDWWLERADFYDQELMPNVRIVDSLAELKRPGRKRADIQSQVEYRNSLLFEKRGELLRSFLALM